MKTYPYQASGIKQGLTKLFTSDFIYVLKTGGSVAALGLVLMAVVGVLLRNPVMAQSTATGVVKSIERQSPNVTATLSERDKKALLEAKAKSLISLDPTLTHSLLKGRVTREQMIAAHKANPQSRISQKVSSNEQNLADKSSVYHSFSIYEASTRLYEDSDYDGFYQTFGVTFDADVDTVGGPNTALVFAELYLSQDGGPWVHYFTTESFIISGNSNLDDYEVLTTLNAGYDMDHYDVLIDLYEVGYGDIVASISSNETDALYALPLESSELDSDTGYVEVTVTEVSSGSLSFLGLVLIGGLALVRRKLAIS